MKTVAFIFISPLLGFILGSLFMLGVSWLYFRTAPQGRPAVPPPPAGVGGLYSLGHGGNDAQKTIGIIWMLLIAPAMRRRRRMRRPCG
jgi:PiT family inorganic phosphate transporter